MIALLVTLQLLCFLTAALLLAALAERAGLAARMAAALTRAARGSGVWLYVLCCLTWAGLTATVSLDGAIVLALPVVLALAEGTPALRRPLLLGAIGVTNAASLAVPQGNPTNLVVMERLGLGPGGFVAHLLVPGLAAALLCAIAPAVAGRRALRAAHIVAEPAPERAPGERLAAAALAAAALAGATSPWTGIDPWLSLGVVAAVAAVAARFTDAPVAPLVVPWRIGAQIGALVAVTTLLPAVSVMASAPLALVGVALAAAAVAGLLNNLPASVALAGVLGAPGATAYAALAGLSVGALATPRGSVATLLAFERAGRPPRYVTTVAPVALVATALAALLAGQVP